MIRRIRQSFWTKVLSVYLAINLLGELVFPTMSLALTSGPVSIDQASFEPAATSEMVDLATGDFTYNIPLLDVDGYPINLAYHGDINMEQEASIVGLGWTINVGAMNRMKRGLPDDFKGDAITTEMNVRPKTSTGIKLGVGVEFLGYENTTTVLEGLPGIDGVPGPPIEQDNYTDDLINPTIGGSIGVTFDNYTGYSLDIGANGGLKIGDDESFYKVGVGIGLESSSQNGISIDPSLNVYASVLDDHLKLKLGIGTTINSVQGLQSISTTTGIGFSNGDGTFGIGSLGVIPVSSISYTPTLSFETQTKIQSYDFDLGNEFLTVYTNGKLSVTRSITCLKSNAESALAYGYLYEGLQDPQTKYLLDFNREGTILPSKHVAYLPATNHTYDVYSATAQGLGFSSRPFRSDILVVSDPYKESTITGFGVSGELGFGNLVQFGLNLNFSTGYIRSGNWTENSLNSKLVPNGDPGELYENFYFKKFENRSSSLSDYIDDVLGGQAIRQSVVESGVNHISSNNFISYFNLYSGTTPSVLNLDAVSSYKPERDLRNTNIQYLTAEDAKNISSEVIRSYDISPSGYDYTGKDYPASSPISRYGTLSTQAKKHHISEMSVLEGDGSRYVYGIPVINSVTKEVVFNASNKYPDALSSDITPSVYHCSEGLVEYDPAYGASAGDNSTNNRRGDNNLFISNQIPAYATSYLLTSYLAPNYEDLTGDGPSPDDLGHYIKFNYSKSASQTKWRIPFEENSAAYNEGLKADPYDDMGSYIYGEKDNWFLHSIESKNFVAEFHYGDRHDGYGVNGENGGIAGSNNSKKLEYISLYTREGKESGEAPIKSVHFVYSYTLCQGIPNNDGTGSDNAGGKLTLEAIYFTYGKSNKGKLYQYKFDYDAGNALANPDYALGQTNRWGTYTSQNSTGTCDFDDPLTNFEYPYANQDQSTADQDAAAWMLRAIDLPSGSRLEFDFESDDYSYVQDKEAMRMFKIRGVSDDGTTVVEHLYDADGDKNYLHIDLGNELAGLDHAQSTATFKSEYVGDITELYFKFLIDVTDADNPEQIYQYVSGYAEIDPNNIYTADLVGSDGVEETGLIRLKSVHIKDKKKEPSGSHGVHPITKASWQFTRKYLPTIINPIVGDIYHGNDAIPYGYNCDVPDEVPADPDDDDPEPSEETKEDGKLLMNMYNLGTSQMQNLMSFGGINFMMKSRGYSTFFEPSKSWVRLYQGRKNKKLGGGHRVKKIEVTDNWNDVKSNELTSTYGTEYSYTQTDTDGKTISSGVAHYEPVTSGGDENSMRNPIKYNIDVKFRVNDEEFQEKPFVESMISSTEIVYSQVTVKNINYSGVSQNATGKTVYEFYTARDFPVIVQTTNRVDNSHIETKSSGWATLFTGNNHDYLTMTQGYSIQMNDMHGKFKSKRVYGESTSPTPVTIYSLEHTYYRDPSNEKLLYNEMNVVDETGTISTKTIGRDLDMVVDLSKSESYHSSETHQFGLDVTFLAPLPSYWMMTSSQENIFRSSVTTKVLYSNGILEQIKLTDKSRSKFSKNILFDANTGVPIVTEIKHEVGKDALPVYQYDYPAYWAYPGMGLASENWGAKFVNLTNDDGKVTLTNYKDFVNPGDELIVYDESNVYKGIFWVIEDESSGTDDYYIIDREGELPTFYVVGKDYTYKVIRSGKRNVLGATMASVVSLDHEFFTYGTNDEIVISESPYAQGYEHTKVINASAVEYTERAFGYEGTVKGASGPACGLVEGVNTNPYVQGLLLNWNLLASHVFDGSRDYATGNARVDGLITDYLDFWQNNGTAWVKTIQPHFYDHWLQVARAILFDPEGYNLESVNALGIYSSILLGYNKTIKIAEAVNSRYYEIGFDGFEDRDYDLYGCQFYHFRFGESEDLSFGTENAHTGKYSLLIGANSTISHESKVTNDIDHTISDHTVPYEVQAQELIGTHTFEVSTTEDKRYVFTAWVKETGSGLGQVLSYDNAAVTISGVTLSDVTEKRSNIIDGWQRIEIDFTVPAMTASPTTSILIELENTGSNNMYFDDVRIQPYNSEMVSYVINPLDLRLWATLDARNFATIYQYDEEGTLVRIIKETERGKVTVQENRAGIRIN